MRATVKLVLRNSYTTQKGKQQLVLRYVAHKESTFIGLGISLIPKHWYKASLMVRAGEPLSNQFNNIITKIYQRAVNIVLSSHGKPLTKNEFRNLLFEN